MERLEGRKGRRQQGRVCCGQSAAAGESAGREAETRQGDERINSPATARTGWRQYCQCPHQRINKTQERTETIKKIPRKNKKKEKEEFHKKAKVNERLLITSADEGKNTRTSGIRHTRKTYTVRTTRASPRCITSPLEGR